MYEVTREQLEKIRDEQKSVSLDSNITLAAATACVTLSAALEAGITGTVSFAIFAVTAVASAAIALICGARWYHRVRKVPNLVDRILNRRIDPEP